MKACCVHYGKGVLNLRVKRIIQMSCFWDGSNYRYWFISTGFYRYWLLPVNSPTWMHIRKHVFPKGSDDCYTVGEFFGTVFTNIFQDMVRK